MPLKLLLWLWVFLLLFLTTYYFTGVNKKLFLLRKLLVLQEWVCGLANILKVKTHFWKWDLTPGNCYSGPRSLEKMSANVKQSRNAWGALSVVEEGMENLREVGELEWIFLGQPEVLPGDYIPWEGPEDTSFTKATRNVLVRGAPHY